MFRTFQSLALAAAVASFGGVSAQAADYYALDGFNLYEIDSAGVTSNLGAITGGSPFGFGRIDTAPDGTVYATAPGLISGFSVYSVDPNTLAATLVSTPAVSQSGGVGIAVDPSGTSVWVAGFIGFSLNVNVQEIDIATGVATDRGSFGGNAWGIAFDNAGQLFATIQGAGLSADLIKVDMVDAAFSTLVGPVTGTLDVSFGLELASDRGNGSVTLLSRATDDLFPLDTTTGAIGTGVTAVGIANLNSIGELPPAPNSNEYYALDGFNLWEVASNGGTTNLGPISGGSPFGFSVMDTAPDGTIYTVAPGLISGFSVYSVDTQTMAATLLATPATGQTGGVGIAVDPSGNSVWVAGFIGLSFNINFQQIDIATGVATDRGNFGGNSWGLAFDNSGSLFMTRQGGGLFAELWKIDQTDAGFSTMVGTIPNSVDVSFGLDLCSDRGAGSVSLLSRANDEIYLLDTTNATVGGPLAAIGVGNLFSIGERQSCFGSAVSYGAGCAGSGGFVPNLTVTGCPVVGDTIQITIDNALGGSSALLFVGVGQGSVPVGGGCSFLINTLATSISIPLGGAGFGNGNVTFPAALPPSASGLSVTMQAFVIDGANPIGAAGSNGVEIMIP